MLDQTWDWLVLRAEARARREARNILHTVQGMSAMEHNNSWQEWQRQMIKRNHG